MRTSVLPRLPSSSSASPSRSRTGERTGRRSGEAVASLLPWVVLGAGGLWLLTGEPLAAVGLLVLWAGWRWLPRFEGPPVIPLAFTFQWLQVTLGVYYVGLTGRTLPPVLLSDYRPMVAIGLGCMVALILGLRLGARPWRPPANLANHFGGARPNRTVPMATLLAAYLVLTASQGPLQALAWQIPLVTQGILAVGFLRLALLFLVYRRLLTPPVRYQPLVLLTGFEVILGFTGYFAGFREPLMILALAMMERFDLRRARHWAALTAVGLIMVTTALLWISIRIPYREDFQLEAFAESRTARLERIGDLSSDWLDSSREELLDDVDSLADRLWAIYYPALAVSRVPEVVPHEDGRILGAAVRHIVMPRLLFPDKPPLTSDSQMVRRYSGIWVAGPEHGASIAFGYAAESYVDFGVPWMFLPVFVWALFLGWAYRFLSHRLILHRELAVALVTVVFWLVLYLFERSWIKTLGFSITLMIYLGATVFLLDRWLLARKRRRLRAQPVTGTSARPVPRPSTRPGDASPTPSG